MPYDPHGTYQDGYCGGSELPSDSQDLDPMIYPERPAKVDVAFNPGESFAEYENRVHEQQEATDRANFQRDRSFRITVGAATGQKPGPPRTIQPTHEEE